MKNKKYLNCPIYSTGCHMQIKIDGAINEVKSTSQHIIVAESQEFGKILVIDSVVQCAEKDHEIYDKAILSKLGKKDKNLLILGAGSGYVPSLALKKNPKLKITIVDLDNEVVEFSKKFLGQRIFGNKNIDLRIEDALKYLEKAAKEGKIFCGIVCDLTDTPVGAIEKAKFKRFYGEVIALSKRCLEKNGWLSIQAGAAEVSGSYLNGVDIIEKNLKKERFYCIIRKDFMIPSFGEKNAFLFGKK
jgi:spermidine synthase